MAPIVYSEDALADFERIIDFQLEHNPQDASSTLEHIKSAVLILAVHPLIGRPVDGLRRELVISRGAKGYLALYRFEPALNLVRILRIRQQREVGYPS